MRRKQNSEKLCVIQHWQGSSYQWERLTEAYLIEGIKGREIEKWSVLPYTEGFSLLAESNRDAIREGSRHHNSLPSEGEGKAWFNAGSEGVWVRVSYRPAYELCDALESYPALNENDHSNREMELEQTAWGEWGRDDMRYELRERVQEFGINVEIIDNLLDCQIDAIYEDYTKNSERCTFEDDYNGTNAVFFTSSCAKAWEGLVPDLAVETASFIPLEPRVAYDTSEVASWSLIATIPRCCPRCGMFSPAPEKNKEYKSAFYLDCGDPLCDVTFKALAPAFIRGLIQQALTGNKEDRKAACSVLQDYAEEHWEYKRHWHFESISRENLKRLALGQEL